MSLRRSQTQRNVNKFFWKARLPPLSSSVFGKAVLSLSTSPTPACPSKAQQCCFYVDPQLCSLHGLFSRSTSLPFPTQFVFAFFNLYLPNHLHPNFANLHIRPCIKLAKIELSLMGNERGESMKLICSCFRCHTRFHFSNLCNTALVNC